jgi:hypothetical protein
VGACQVCLAICGGVSQSDHAIQLPLVMCAPFSASDTTWRAVPYGGLRDPGLTWYRGVVCALDGVPRHNLRRSIARTTPTLHGISRPAAREQQQAPERSPEDRGSPHHPPDRPEPLKRRRGTPCILFITEPQYLCLNIPGAHLEGPNNPEIEPQSTVTRASDVPSIQRRSEGSNTMAPGLLEHRFALSEPRIRSAGRIDVA